MANPFSQVFNAIFGSGDGATAAGAAIGTAVGGPVGGLIGGAVGSLIGGSPPKAAPAAGLSPEQLRYQNELLAQNQEFRGALETTEAARQRWMWMFWALLGVVVATVGVVVMVRFVTSAAVAAAKRG